MQLQLKDGEVTKLKETESKYAVNSDCCSNYSFEGDLDSGESLQLLISNLEAFYGQDIAAAILVIGGTAMAFHYQQLTDLVGGVPPTLAVGDPVSGKSTAVECAMALFNQRECIGAGSEAKLLESLVNRTIPMWWDDIDSLAVLEKLTVLLYNKAKKVTMSKDTLGSTVPVISVNYSKLIKGFKKLKMGQEDFGRLFTRMLPIPFRKRTIGKKRIKERIEGRSQLEGLMREVPKSVTVVLKLHSDYKAMTKDKLFSNIQDVVEESGLDVRSEANFSVLLFTTGKILQHIGLFSAYWEEVVNFFQTQMVPKYQELLIGNCDGIEAVRGNTVTDDADFWEAFEQLFRTAVSHPEEAKKFFKAKYNTKGCSCGEAIAVSLAKAVPFSKLKLSSAALTHGIDVKGVGCTGKSMRIGDSSSTCVHISRRKIPQRLLDILDGGSDDSSLQNQDNVAEVESGNLEVETGVEAESVSMPGCSKDFQQSGEHSPMDKGDLEVLELGAVAQGVEGCGERYYMDEDDREKFEFDRQVLAHTVEATEKQPPQKSKGKGRRKGETESLRDGLTPLEDIPTKRSRKEVTYK